MPEKTVMVEVEGYINNLNIQIFEIGNDELGSINSNDVQVVLDDVIARVSHLIKGMSDNKFSLSYSIKVKDNDDGIQLLQE